MGGEWVSYTNIKEETEIETKPKLENITTKLCTVEYFSNSIVFFICQSAKIYGTLTLIFTIDVRK